jgi:hypothetical protein
MDKDTFKRLVADATDAAAVKFLAHAGRPLSRAERERLEQSLALFFLRR